MSSGTTTIGSYHYMRKHYFVDNTSATYVVEDC
jgi:hypothetical protein